MTDGSDLTDWLQTIRIFRGLSRSQLRSVAQIAQLKQFNKGEPIFQQGSEATGFFVVKTGRVKIFKVSANGIDALQKAGCQKIYHDKISGAKAERTGLAKTLELSRAGDIIVIWRLDRLGRSIKDLIQISETLKERSIGLNSLQEGIDTTTSTGQLMFNLLSVLAEFERNLIRERSKAGLDAARSRGKLGGRPKSLNRDRQQLVVKLYNDREHSIAQICQMMSISKPTLYKYVAAAAQNTPCPSSV